MAHNESLKVMAAGHICLDITPVFESGEIGSFETLLCPGKLVNVGRAVLSTGGSVANTGLAMAKLGADVLLNGKIGDDEIGEIIKTLVGQSRADSLRTVSGQTSSYSIVLAVPGVDRIFLHHPGTNDTFTADDIDYEALKGCCLFHFGYPTLMKRFYENDGDELVNMFERAKRTGVVTSLDMSLPDPNSASGRVDWRRILQRVLPMVDIFLPSIEEIAFMLDRPLFEKRKMQAGRGDPVLFYSASDCAGLSTELLDMGAAIAAIKNGIRGYYLQTSTAERLAVIHHRGGSDVSTWARRQLWAGSYKAQVFGSATGAGDATIAGFLIALLKGLDPVASLKIANLLGWQSIRHMDALSGIEDWPTALSTINNDTISLNALDIADSGWCFQPQSRLFYGPKDCAAGLGKDITP